MGLMGKLLTDIWMQYLVGWHLPWAWEVEREATHTAFKSKEKKIQLHGTSHQQIFIHALSQMFLLFYLDGVEEGEVELKKSEHMTQDINSLAVSLPIGHHN